MAGLTRDELISKLQGAGVQFTCHEHAAVMTVQEQAEALTGLGATVKNIFAKDKKNRLYILSALPDTKVDMNVLSARLGVGKGGLRFAPEELLEEVLQVPLGSVTPLAVANPSAARVVLFLDERMRSAERLLVHPLVNTASLGMGPPALEQALRALGREPIYVDFGLDPKIDRENPPDLAKHTVEPVKQAEQAGGAGAAPAPQQQQAQAAANAKKGGAAGQAAVAPSQAAGAKGSKPGQGKAGGAKGGAAQGAAAPVSAYAQQQAATDVAAQTEELLQMVSHSLLGQGLEASGAGKDSYALVRLRADVESRLNTLKNSAYAMGFSAGRGAVVAYVQKQFA